MGRWGRHCDRSNPGRRKAAAGAGDQQAAHAIIALGLLQTFRQLVMHQIVKTVEAVRAIEGNGRDALFHCAENEASTISVL